MTDKNLNTNELKYVLLNGSELWEIDYASGSAIEVSEVMRKDSMKLKPIEYSGSIEDYLINQRKCKNVHFHNSALGSARAHIKTPRRTFDK
ncbi:MAG: hypothetical protein M3530_00645 [Thermoproteota archaeon]|nr:hypothetical protein [Thermoproteota archaeon]